MFDSEYFLKLSMILFIIVALSACSTIQEYWIDDKASLYSETYTVNKGDTLYSIAWLYELDYRRLAQWNDVKAPNYLIYPGQQLHLSAPESAMETQEATPTAPPSTTQLSGWFWPLNKPEVEALPRSNALLMKGKASEVVHSASAGIVVYSGFNLKHYRGLIIIKHDGDIFSVYGNNKELLVVEQEQIAAEQEIARLYDKQDDANLYFEIRYRNQSLKAVKYLPDLKLSTR